ncbi:hypothetical protein [Phaffia rhodozyma]|uniref:Uncharacterized protein n=1 Tax=Phaffia rhodozyma TaxID=264483 RepID=A0A0F7SIQ2_PHARH|nr:hypothetical protein [Phaffia rhodozyma]
MLKASRACLVQAASVTGRTVRPHKPSVSRPAPRAPAARPQVSNIIFGTKSTAVLDPVIPADEDIQQGEVDDVKELLEKVTVDDKDWINSAAAFALPVLPTTRTPFATPESHSDTSSTIKNAHPALKSLLEHLKSPRAHSRIVFSLAEVNRSNGAWDLYKDIPNKADIPPAVWSDILRSVVPPKSTASHFYSRKHRRHLTGYLRTGYEERLHQVLKDQIQIGIVPNRKDYHFIMRHFANAGYVKSTEAVYRSMVARDIPPSSDSFTIRLKAIVEWMTRYQQVEGKILRQEEMIASFDTALASVPPLVSEIMRELQENSPAVTLSKPTIDYACQLFSIAGDWDAFNVLARYGYGVDLDTPDAVPEEWLKRVESDDGSLQRGLTKRGMNSLIHLLNMRGEYWKALSMWETFNYRLPAPENPDFRGLDWESSQHYRPRYIKKDDLIFMPALPPTTARAYMNNLPQSLTTINQTRPQTSFPDPSINLTERAVSALLQGPINDPNRSAYIPLIKHHLLNALASHYTDRQSQMATLVKLATLPVEKAQSRQHLLRTLKPHQGRARMKWFFWLTYLRKDLKNGGRNAREIWDILAWADEEARLYRISLEADQRIVELAIEALQIDEDLATRKPKLQDDAKPRKEADVSLERLLEAIKHEIMIYKRDVRAFIPLAQIETARADLMNLRNLYNTPGNSIDTPLSSILPMINDPAGPTIGSRVNDYAVFLAERLTYELEPTLEPVGESFDPETLLNERFATLDRLETVSRRQIKRRSSLNLFPSRERGTLYDLKDPDIEVGFPMAVKEIKEKASASEA